MESNTEKTKEEPIPTKELLEKCRDWNSKLCRTGGQAWTLSVPVNFSKDPDMLFETSWRRLEKTEADLEELKKERDEFKRVAHVMSSSQAETYQENQELKAELEDERKENARLREIIIKSICRFATCADYADGEVMKFKKENNID